MIVLVFLTAFIAGASGYGVGMQKNQRRLATPIPTSQPTTLSLDPATGWRTFQYDSRDERNRLGLGLKRSEIPQLQYHVEFPPNWTLETGTDTDRTFGDVVLYSSGDRSKATRITIGAKRDIINYTPDSFLTDYPSNNPAIKQEAIALPAGLGVSITEHLPGAGGELSAPINADFIQRVYFQQPNNIVYIFELYQAPGDNYKDVFSKLLSTFRPETSR